jgi:predicted RNase H-like HicB family nuclease
MLSSDKFEYVYKQFRKEYKDNFFGFLTRQELRAVISDAETIDEATQMIDDKFGKLLKVMDGSSQDNG